MAVIPKRYDPATLRWWGGRLTVDDPDTGRRVPVDSIQPTAPVAPLPAAAQAILDENPDLTREQAAAFLRITPATLSDWASKKRGPPYTDFGQMVRYPLAALAEWRALQMKNVVSTTEPEPVKRGRGRPRREPV
ncbi:helix-turn-helix domain-containing protein [Belnapia moabensis]|uniref:helix-turn-helix domain-containing protein n=1 Tax=Belnapia moabensis TaxID=365533 RepID=UPI0005BB707A|nr:helix-turn-helix domain-containing protein [Belnapia moabensis]